MPYCPSGRGASRLGRKEAFGSQDLMMKREGTHRGNLKLEKMVTENPGSACFSGLGNHLLSPLNQRACHTKDRSGEWPRPDTGVWDCTVKRQGLAWNLSGIFSNRSRERRDGTGERRQPAA